MSLPRCEHPKPQFIRDNWMNLNGKWDFEIDNACSGADRQFITAAAPYSQSITVPFCPESRLSGVEQKDFMRCVWYRRTVTLSAEQLQGRVFLHFGAVDYTTTVYVNEKEVGRHIGGYVSFAFDITESLHSGDNLIVVRAEDDTRNALIPTGKQSTKFESYSCLYTRSTGIWQTVWLEFVPNEYIKSVHYSTDIHTPSVTVSADLCGRGDFSALVSFNGVPMGEAQVHNAAGRVEVTVPLKETHLWEVGKGNLYDVTMHFAEDSVASYFGLRTVAMDGYRFLLNGRSVFQRLILDQGYYPDGIYTAPSDAELEADVKRSMAMGFNGARLHQKVFEERFLYHCDRHGYLVWSEYPSWGIDMSKPEALQPLLREWLAEMERDKDHPSVVGWCPLNETWTTQHRPTVELLYKATKAVDPGRPCIDTSGYMHVITDIFDLHDYDQNPETFRNRYASFAETGELQQPEFCEGKQTYRGQPVFVSEYGGIRWSDDENGWGYGQGPVNKEEFFSRFRGLTEAQLKHPNFFGFCYTQLTDVEQEQNGLYTYDRRPKFPSEEIAAIVSQKAEIEE